MNQKDFKDRLLHNERTTNWKTNDGYASASVGQELTFGTWIIIFKTANKNKYISSISKLLLLSISINWCSSICTSNMHMDVFPCQHLEVSGQFLLNFIQISINGMFGTDIKLADLCLSSTLVALAQFHQQQYQFHFRHLIEDQIHFRLPGTIVQMHR